jgi:hypothetical protein
VPWRAKKDLSTIVRGVRMSWVLILYIYAGMMAKGDSVALTTTTFANEEACIAAGKKANSLTLGTAKNVRYVCVRNM